MGTHDFILQELQLLVKGRQEETEEGRHVSLFRRFGNNAELFVFIAVIVVGKHGCSKLHAGPGQIHAAPGST